jgi:hypothetical protein
VLGALPKNQIPYGCRRLEVVPLAQHAHAQPPGVRDPAGVGLQLPRDDRDERGLAAPVAPHDADALTLLDPE